MLQVKNLNIYYGRHRVIINASFKIQPGEIIGLIGPNGAGKSTIMKTILGLTKFTGTIIFNGQKITLTKHTALQHVGALIENPALQPFLTGRENLSLYANDQAELAKIVSMLEIDQYIDRRAGDYSIGMKQKLGIALAFLNHPQLVILDEPMNELDIEATILVCKIIHRYATAGTAFLISSHVLSELQKVMTSIIILNRHEIIMDVPIDQFKNTPVSKVKLKATDNSAAKVIQTNNGLDVHQNDNYLIINITDVDQVQNLLYQHQIMLRELTPVHQNFEQVVVNVLKKNRRDTQ